MIYLNDLVERVWEEITQDPLEEGLQELLELRPLFISVKTLEDLCCQLDSLGYEDPKDYLLKLLVNENF